MIGNPLDHLQRDLEAAARDIDDLDLSDVNAGLAGAFREEVPVVTGFLQSTVFSDRDGVGVGAVYAGVVARSNPYDERALARFDVGAGAADAVDDVLAAHLSPLYV